MKKLILSIASAAFLASIMNAAIISNGEASASCLTGDPHSYTVNKIQINGTMKAYPYSSFSEVGGSGDYGVSWACNGDARGTMFFTQPTAWTYSGGVYTLNVNAFVDLGKTSQTMGVMGMIHTKYDGTSNYGDRVAFCLSSDCSPSNADTDIFTSYPSTIWRASSDNNGSGWTAPEYSYPVTINGKKLAERYGTIHYDSYGYATITVYNHRCYNGLDSGCGASPIKLVVRRAASVSSFDSQSGVKVDGYQTDYTWSPKDDTATTKTVYVDNATVDVYFNHYIKREGDIDFAVSNTLSVSGDGGGNDSKSFSWNKNGNSGQYFNKTRKKTVTATTAGATVCDSATHAETVNTFGETSGSSTSKACVKIIRRSSSCDVKENQGSLVVANATNGQTWTGSTPRGNSDSGSIWAKPGDRVNFKYDLCAGGQSAVDEYNEHPDLKKTTCNTYVNGLCTDWNYEEITINKDTTYNFSGTNSTASSANRGKYLFGTDSPFNTSTGSASWSAKDASDYHPVYHSPNTDGYECPDSSGPIKYYQVPQVVASCKSAIKVGRDSDTGSIITQSLSWDYFKFNTRTDIEGNNTKKLTADVKIPYNYIISSKNQNTSPNLRYIPGNSYSVTYNIKPAPRINKQVSATTAYATETKPTTIRAYYFIIPPSVSEANVDSHLVSKFGNTRVKDKDGNNDGYYVSSITTGMGLTRITGVGEENLIIDSDGYSLPINIPINDTTKSLSLGAKLCIVTAASPADSHNYLRNATIDDTSQANAFLTSGSGWKISEPTCYTSTKIPSFATVGASLYADGNIKTAIQDRQTSENSTVYSFGSWTDYALNVRGNVEGFSSGATMYGGVNNSNATACRLSPLTISNKNCSSKSFGGAGIASSNISAPKNVVDMIVSRYTQPSVGDTVTPGGIADVSGGCNWDAGSNRYVRSGGSGYECLENGTKYIHSSGTIYVGKAEEGWYMLYGHGDDYASRTVVIHSEQKVVIREGSVYGNSDASSVLDNHKLKYNKPSEFPQLLVIAPEIDIWGAVTNIDGWLIARSKDGTPGVINTCTNENGVQYSYASNKSDYYNFCNRQLTVNGPVYAQRINLLRAYGGGSSTTNTSSNTDSDGAVRGMIAKPAEYFNIPTSTYYWLFNQSERYQQAATTYQRELSPRY